MNMFSDSESNSVSKEHSEFNKFKRPVEENHSNTDEYPPEKKPRVNGSQDQKSGTPDRNGNTTIDINNSGNNFSTNVNGKDEETKREVTKETFCDNSKTSKSKSQQNQTFLNHHAKDHIVKSTHQKNFQIVLKSPKKKLSDLMYIEHYENGGGYILHSYQDELVRLEKADLDAFVAKYYKTLFAERSKKNIPVEFANYCIGIIHGAAEPIPDLLHYMSQNYGHMSVKSNAMEAKNDMISLTMKDYASNVYSSYSCGLYRYGPLHAISIVGTKGEETGNYCSDVIKMLEKNPFLRILLPWGELSHLKGMNPKKSDDGPILWTRPGEQCIPTKSTPMKRKSKLNLDSGGMVGNLPMFGRGAIPRSTFIPDRTPCHADHADDGLLRHTTAAVGVLKAVHPKGKRSSNAGRRIVKDAVLFDPRHYMHLIHRLQLDIMEPPATQCGNYWAEDAELNQLRVEGFTYVRVQLRDDDIYFIPRNVVHQFKTVSSVTSVAWHIRLKSYYKTEQQPPPSDSAIAKSDQPNSTKENPASDLSNQPESNNSMPATGDSNNGLGTDDVKPSVNSAAVDDKQTEEFPAPLHESKTDTILPPTTADC